MWVFFPIGLFPNSLSTGADASTSGQNGFFYTTLETNHVSITGDSALKLR